MQEEISFKLGLDAASFLRGITSIKAQLKDLTTEKWESFTKGFAVTALAAKLSSVGSEMVRLRRAAEEQGVSTTFLQAFGKLAEKFGGDAQDADGALTKLNVKIGEAADVSSAAAKSFAKYGIALADSNGFSKTTEEIMRELMDRYRALPDAASRAALAMDIFGRSGSHIAQVLALGNAEFDRMTAKMEESGKILKPEEVKTYADAWLAVKSAVSEIGEPFVTLTEKVVRGWQIISRTLDGMRFKSLGVAKALEEAVASTKPSGEVVKVKADTTQATEAVKKLRQTMADEFAKLGDAIAAALTAYRNAANGLRLTMMVRDEIKQREKVLNAPEGSQRRIEEQAALNAMMAARESRELQFLNQQHEKTRLEMQALGERFHLAGDVNEREKAKLELTKKGLELAKQEEEIARRGGQIARDQGDRQRELNKLVQERNAMIANAQAAAMNATQSLAAAKRDRVNYTLEELANGNPRGVRDASVRQDIFRARELQRILGQAEAARARGDTSMADKLFAQADERRAQIGSLKGDERFPFAQLVKAQEDAVIKLTEVLRDGKARFRAGMGP